VTDFAQIITDVEHGNSLRKYLSRDIEKAVTPPVDGFKRRPDLDLMLNDWGVHHLHISTRVEADGYVARDVQDEPLLFAVFRPLKAYFVGVFEHGDWTQDDILKVLASEWPDEGVIYEMPGLNTEPNVTDKERKASRGKHCNVFFSYMGKTYKPSGGMSASGTTSTATIEAMRLLSKATAFGKHLESDPEWINLHDVPQFQFEIRDDGYVLKAVKQYCWVRVVKSEQWWRP
jgi:hypothetical protein